MRTFRFVVMWQMVKEELRKGVGCWEAPGRMVVVTIGRDVNWSCAPRRESTGGVPGMERTGGTCGSGKRNPYCGKMSKRHPRHRKVKGWAAGRPEARRSRW